jgi:hypothetical protein
MDERLFYGHPVTINDQVAVEVSRDWTESEDE